MPNSIIFKPFSLKTHEYQIDIEKKKKNNSIHDLQTIDLSSTSLIHTFKKKITTLLVVGGGIRSHKLIGLTHLS